MSKPLLFYTVDEKTDVEKFCKRRGLKPHIFEIKELDGVRYSVVDKYIKDGYIYDVLNYDERCYSGYMVTLMRLPKLSFEELLNTALSSKSFQERAGAIGILLKDYPKEFERFLSDFNKNIGKGRQLKQIKRLAGFITDNRSHYSDELGKIVALCKRISETQARKQFLLISIRNERKIKKYNNRNFKKVNILPCYSEEYVCFSLSKEYSFEELITLFLYGNSEEQIGAVSIIAQDYDYELYEFICAHGEIFGVKKLKYLLEYVVPDFLPLSLPKERLAGYRFDEEYSNCVWVKILTEIRLQINKEDAFV